MKKLIKSDYPEESINIVMNDSERLYVFLQKLRLVKPVRPAPQTFYKQ